MTLTEGQLTRMKALAVRLLHRVANLRNELPTNVYVVARPRCQPVTSAATRHERNHKNGQSETDKLCAH